MKGDGEHVLIFKHELNALYQVCECLQVKKDVWERGVVKGDSEDRTGKDATKRLQHCVFEIVQVVTPPRVNQQVNSHACASSVVFCVLFSIIDLLRASRVSVRSIFLCLLAVWRGVSSARAPPQGSKQCCGLSCEISKWVRPCVLASTE